MNKISVLMFDIKLTENIKTWITLVNVKHLKIR